MSTLACGIVPESRSWFTRAHAAAMTWAIHSPSESKAVRQAISSLALVSSESPRMAVWVSPSASVQVDRPV